MYGVDGGGTRASGPTCTRRAFQVGPHSTAASKQLLLADIVVYSELLAMDRKLTTDLRWKQ